MSNLMTLKILRGKSLPDPESQKTRSLKEAPKLRVGPPDGLLVSDGIGGAESCLLGVPCQGSRCPQSSGDRSTWRAAVQWGGPWGPGASCEQSGRDDLDWAPPQSLDRKEAF